MGSGMSDKGSRLIAGVMTKIAFDAADLKSAGSGSYLEKDYKDFKENDIADKAETQMFIDALEGREEPTDPNYGKPFSQTIRKCKNRNQLIRKKMEEYEQFKKDIAPKIKNVKKKIKAGIVTSLGKKITIKIITPGMLLRGYFCLEKHRIPNIDYCHMGKYNIMFPMHDKIWSVFLNEEADKIMESRVSFFEFIDHLEARDQVHYMTVWGVTNGAPENPISRDGIPSRQFLESIVNYDHITREHHDMSREVIFVLRLAYYFLKNARLIDRIRYYNKFCTV